MNDEARAKLIDATYALQTDIERLTNKLHLERRTATNKHLFTEATLALADLSNQVMMLRMIAQPSRMT